MSRSHAARRRETDALLVFLEYLAEIDEAVIARDALRLTTLLRKRTATHLPKEIRDELLAFSRSSPTSLRAPIQFFRFHHRMMELTHGGEAMLTAQHELPFDDADDSIETGVALRRAEPSRRAAAARRRDDSRGRGAG